MLPDRRWSMCAGVLLALMLACVGARAQAPPPEPRFAVTGFAISGENPLSETESAPILAPYLGQHEGIAGLLAAADALEQALADRGFSFRRVVLPPQALEGGVVQLEVVAFHIGKITVSGNRHYSESNVLRALPGLVSGAVPETARLSHQRYVANRNPSRQVELRFQESDTEQAIDASVAVQDRDPNSFFVGYDNTGSRDTGATRVTFGAQLGNLFDRDHSLGLTYVTSPTAPGKVQQWAASYSAPLYRFGGTLSGYAVNSDVNTGLVGALDISGAGTFLGANYTHYLTRRGRLTHDVTLAIDDKRFTTDVLSGGVPLVGVTGITDVRSRPVTLTYSGSVEIDNGAAGFNVSYARNLPRGRDNDSAAYGGSRIGADPVWDVLRVGATFDYAPAGEWLLRSRADAQFAHEPLISGEQFGSGGARSVRGFQEREITGDAGIFASLEGWSPTLLDQQGLRAIGFVEFAHARLRKRQALQRGSQSIASLGGGIRWVPDEQLSIQIDVARAMNAVGTRTNNPLGTHSGDYRTHFSLLFQF